MQDADFDIIEEMGADADKRHDLLEIRASRLVAHLYFHDRPRYERLMTGLKQWGSLPALKAAVKGLISEGRAKLARQKIDGTVQAAVAAGRPAIDIGNPVDTAMAFRAARHPHLILTDGQWLDYSTNCYRPLEDREVRSAVQDFMASGVDVETGKDYHPTLRAVTEVVEALSNICFRSTREAGPPVWLETDTTEPDPKAVVAARNGLLDVMDGTLMAHSWTYFTRNGLDYDFDPVAIAPAWMAFLESIWPTAEGGKENQDALQEVLGYLLTGDTKWQKIFLLIGAPNAGKGVIARVIEGLIGSRNVVSQSVTKLGREFGLKALLGKSVLVVPDLRLGRDTNVGGVTEVLLNISGEDSMGVARKFEDDIQVRLRTRVVLCANMELVLPDQSGAMRRRLFPLVFPKTFIGREDVGLTDKLLAESPGILNWALEGLRRLEGRTDEDGRKVGFVLTTEGRRMVDRIARRGSPVHSFVREACDLGAGKMVRKATLYETFEQWCAEQDEPSNHSEESFGRELRIASGYAVETTRPRLGGDRVRCYTGIAIKPEWTDFGY